MAPSGSEEKRAAGKAWKKACRDQATGRKSDRLLHMARKAGSQIFVSGWQARDGRTLLTADAQREEITAQCALRFSDPAESLEVVEGEVYDPSGPGGLYGR